MSEEKTPILKQGRAPEKEFDPDDIGESQIERPADDKEKEVEGRAIVSHQMKCFKCSRTTWIRLDTETFKAYRCAPCGAVNVL